MCIHIYGVILSEFQKEIITIFCTSFSTIYIILPKCFRISHITAIYINHLEQQFDSLYMHMILGIVMLYVIQISVLHTIMESVLENLARDSWVFSW